MTLYEHRMWVGIDEDWKVTIELDHGESIVMPWSDAVRLGATMLTMAMLAAQQLGNDEETFIGFLTGARNAAMEAMNGGG